MILCLKCGINYIVIFINELAVYEKTAGSLCYACLKVTVFSILERRCWSVLWG